MIIRKFWAVVAGITLILIGAAGMAPVAAANGGRAATPPLVVKTIGRLPNGTPPIFQGESDRPLAVGDPQRVQPLWPRSELGGRCGSDHRDRGCLPRPARAGRPQRIQRTVWLREAPNLHVAQPVGRLLRAGRTPAGHAEREHRLGPRGVARHRVGHAEAPGAKIVLVEAASNSLADLFSAVDAANNFGATEVSMSWDSLEFGGENTYDSHFQNPGALYTVCLGRHRQCPGLPGRLAERHRRRGHDPERLQRDIVRALQQRDRPGRARPAAYRPRNRSRPISRATRGRCTS